jgi:hypothetical protein
VAIGQPVPREPVAVENQGQSPITERCQGAAGIVHRCIGGLVHRSGRLAVSRKPMVLLDALVYELYGLTEEEIRVVERAT